MTLFSPLPIFSWCLLYVQAASNIEKCHDTPADQATKMTANCAPKSGFSWHPEEKKCVPVDEAGCANTLNKFLHLEVCLESTYLMKCCAF